MDEHDEQLANPPSVLAEAALEGWIWSPEPVEGQRSPR
jgi:hypothetical protein